MRVLRAAIFAFGKPAYGIAQWGPLVLTLVGLALTGVGLAIPKPGGYWLAIAGLVSLCVVLFIGVFRLYGVAFPNFPDHRFAHGPLWIFKDRSGNQFDDRIIFQVDYTNKEPNVRVHLTIDLWWVHESKARIPRKLRKDKIEALGPFRFWPRQDDLGNNPVIDRPTDVGPHRRAEGLVAFDIGVVPGLEAASATGDEVRVDPKLRLFARLIDDISGAERDVPLDVKTTDQV